MNQPEQRANGDGAMNSQDKNDKTPAETAPTPRRAQPASGLGPEGGSRVRRRRFRRAQDKMVEGLSASETLASLRAELVLLREENATLKAAQHQVPDLGHVLKRARQVPREQTDRAEVADEATQLLVEGLVLRESLLEVCQEIERSMIAVEAKLNALTPTPGATGPSSIDTGMHAPRALNGVVNGNGNGNGKGHTDIRLAPEPNDTEGTDGHGSGLT